MPRARWTSMRSTAPGFALERRLSGASKPPSVDDPSLEESRSELLPDPSELMMTPLTSLRFRFRLLLLFFFFFFFLLDRPLSPFRLGESPPLPPEAPLDATWFNARISFLSESFSLFSLPSLPLEAFSDLLSWACRTSWLETSLEEEPLVSSNGLFLLNVVPLVRPLNSSAKPESNDSRRSRAPPSPSSGKLLNSWMEGLGAPPSRTLTASSFFLNSSVDISSRSPGVPRPRSPANPWLSLSLPFLSSPSEGSLNSSA